MQFADDKTDTLKHTVSSARQQL